MPLPIWAETLRGMVMHAIGEWAHKFTTSPSLRLATRLANAIASSLGITGAIVSQVAKQALTDWRATQEARTMPRTSAISKAYASNVNPRDCIGVRVILDLEFDTGKPAGSRNSASVLVNITPNQSIADAINAAINAWNNRMISTPHGNTSGSKATGGTVVQVVQGGWSHAQIGEC